MFDAGELGRTYRLWIAKGAKRAGPDPLELADAAWECEHGRLPHDAWRDPACRCWERGPQKPPPVTRNGSFIGDPSERKRWWVSRGHHLGRHPDAQAWKARYEAGESLTDIERSSGAPATTISRHIAALGVTLRPQRRPRSVLFDLERAVALRESGLSWNQLMKEFPGVTRSSLARRVREAQAAGSSGRRQIDSAVAGKQADGGTQDGG